MCMWPSYSDDTRSVSYVRQGNYDLLRERKLQRPIVQTQIWADIQSNVTGPSKASGFTAVAASS